LLAAVGKPSWALEEGDFNSGRFSKEQSMIGCLPFILSSPYPKLVNKNIFTIVGTAWKWKYRYAWKHKPKASEQSLQTVRKHAKELRVGFAQSK